MNRSSLVAVAFLAFSCALPEFASGLENSETATITLPLLAIRPIPDDKGTQAIVKLDIPLLRHVLLVPEDLQQAQILFKGHDKPSAGEPAPITVFKLLTGSLDAAPVAGKDYSESPLASFSAAEGNLVPRQQFAQILQAWLKNEGDSESLLISAGGSSTPVWDQKNGPVLEITFIRHPNAQIFENSLKPTDGVYVQVKNGKLFYGSQRLRLWGVNRHDSPNPDLPDRLAKAGFNAIRLWGPKGLWDDAALKSGKPRESHAGDGSPLDMFDQFFARLKKKGLFVWSTALHAYNPMSRNLKALLAADSFIAGGDDWSQWKQSVSDLMAHSKDPTNIYLPLIYFDERTQRVMKAQASAFLNHVNPYTGKRYAVEETIAVWQVQNENGFTQHLLNGELEKMPSYFRDKLVARWCGWLKHRYGDEINLKKAWGALADGESLDRGTIQLAPMVNQRATFPKARADDFVHFAVDLVVDFNTDFRDFCRAQAPVGVGVNVGPFVFDCQYRPSIPWLAGSALVGDTVSLSTYEWALSSKLTAPPSMLTLDNHTVHDRATLVYETNTGNTNPYRAEFPLRIAALACRQDWDGVFFHIYHAPNEDNDRETPQEEYLAGKLNYLTKADYWSSTAFAPDPALGSALAIAGRIFLNGAIPPAEAPALYRLADDAIYSYDNLNGISQATDTFTRGSRIVFSRQSVGGLKIDRDNNSGPIDSPVTYDTEHGRMVIDTPQAKVLVGPTVGKYQFRDGIVVGDFNKPFAAFAMVSADSKALIGLDPSKKIYITAIDNAVNTGFDMDMSVARAAGGFVPPMTQAAAVRSQGRAPILLDRVGYSAWFPTKLDYRFQGYDFALRLVEDWKGADTNMFRQDAKHELFMGLLMIANRGAAANTPGVESAPAAPPQAAAGAGASAAGVGHAVWNPLPGIQWSDDYATTHEKIRNGTIVRSSVGGTDLPPSPDSVIVIYGTSAILNAQANIEIGFQKGQMSRINAAFTQPPILAEAIAACEKQFGLPVEKIITSNAFETSTVRWVLHQKGAGLEIILTETQGSMSVTYAILPN